MPGRLHILLAIVITLLFPKMGVASVESDAAVLIRDAVSVQGESPEIAVRGRYVRITGMLKRFYRNRNYMPAWSSYGGPFADIDDLIEAVQRAYEEGLNPEDYSIVEIESLADAQRRGMESGMTPDPAVMADLDLLATDTFLSYGYHLLAGRIYPEITDGEWSDYIWEANLDEVLSEALEAGNVMEFLKSLVPPHEGYAELRDALAFYRELAAVGGWPKVPYGRTLRPGDRNRRVFALRERLIMSADLDYDYVAKDDYLFDYALKQAVIKFQKRHGLVPDGIVGPNTLAAMNVPIEKRIEQIELNMERWRWLPEDLGDKYIFVNAAAFELKVVESGETVMRMRIVVGKPYWHTPSFSSKMTYIVVNPSWNVPTSIAVDDILPKLVNDPGFLKRQGFKIITGSGHNSTSLDPGSIDWSEVTEDNLSFRFAQGPGPKNPLGRIKFMFPNRFSVYLHDTPSKGLFNHTVRTFSHGCIRIEKPLELAMYLLPDLTKDDLLKMIKSGDEVDVSLPEPIIVHSLYWTAWLDENGEVNFREDIYGRDAALSDLLSYGPMTP
jgi:murein L,D-transpeptidase YcbB/YkuD